MMKAGTRLFDKPHRTMSHLIAANHKLEYEWHGPAPDKAPTIIFLHEGLGCVAMWKDFPARVAEATGFGALVYSRAGYGNSDPIELPRPVSFMHDDALVVLPEIIDALAIEQPVLFGHSDGASIALIYAGSINAGRVKALILEAPHVFVEDLGIQSITDAKQNFESGTLRSALERYHGHNVDCAFRGWNDVWLDPDFRSWNIESFLSGIKVPTLVIQGENDQYGTKRQFEAIQNGNSGAVETLLLADCGHSPHRDHPDEVLYAVTEFLNRLR